MVCIIAYGSPLGQQLWSLLYGQARRFDRYERRLVSHVVEDG